MSATLFTGGVIWTGTGLESDALLVTDGVVRALGGQARDLASGLDCEHVDLDGGFLMPSFGDGHAHPLYGGLEAVGPRGAPLRLGRRNPRRGQGIRRRTPRARNGSSAPPTTAASRPADCSTPAGWTRWSPTGRWCCGPGTTTPCGVNTAALDRAGITPDTPDPVLGEIPHRARRLGARARYGNGAQPIW